MSAQAELIAKVSYADLSAATLNLDTYAMREAAAGNLDRAKPFQWEMDAGAGCYRLYGYKPLAVEPPTALKPDFNTGLVSMLTELLRRAQGGEINQVALVFTEPGDDHKYGTWISDRTEGSALLLIGAIADLQFTALTLHNEQQKP